MTDETETKNNLSVSNESPLPAVKELLPQVARKIAAGEVIDRPQAIIRELLDNAIDAKATEVCVDIEGGGIAKIRVQDDGVGMTKDDLKICWKPHTTSKISQAEDLLSLSTLGFRGEALCSICTVSDMKITSKREEVAYSPRAGVEYSPRDSIDYSHRDSVAYSLTTNIVYKASSDASEKNSELEKVSWKVKPASLAKGTVVEVKNLFENFPARKAFLKNERTEAQLCKQAFIEKALPWASVGFSFTQDGVLKASYPKGQTFLERSLLVFKPKEPHSFFKTVTGSGEGFSFTCVLGTRDIVRKDRKEMLVFINGRRVSEYSLLQAMDYGAEGCFPNGAHPFSILFLNIDGNLIDFNIHPAKKEVRIKNSQEIHKAVSGAVRSFFHQNLLESLYKDDSQSDDYEFSEEPKVQKEPTLLDETELYQYKKNYSRENISNESFLHDTTPEYGERSFTENKKNVLQNSLNEVSFQDSSINTYILKESRFQDSCDFKYIGQVMNLFLAIEKNNCLFLIDQHAAHERIIFNKLQAQKIEKQELLIPYFLRTKDKSEDKFLTSILSDLQKEGFTLDQVDECLWEVTSIPTRYKGTEKDLQEDLFTKPQGNKPILYEVLARTACRQAIKQGDSLERSTAIELASEALKLPEPFCPHGRPVWIKLSREALFKLIERT